MPDVTSITDAVARLAFDHYALRTWSEVELLARSGYMTSRPEVSEQLLAQSLSRHSDWIDAWFRLSGDNRSSPAWWVGGAGPGRYEIGFFDIDRENRLGPLPFTDKALACAAYVKRHVETTADLIERDERQLTDESRLWRQLRARERHGETE
jgi:hypothetical protein